MTMFKRFELDPFDLLWKDLLETQSHFSAITQRVTHPVDIYETEDGIRFEIAVVGLNHSDIEVSVEGDTLRIKHEKQPSEEKDTVLYRGIKRSSFDLTWKVSTKFDLSNLEATLDKGLLLLNIPKAKDNKVKKIEVKPKTLFEVRG